MAKKKNTPIRLKGPKTSQLQNIPDISLDQTELKKWGGIWRSTTGSVNKKTGSPTTKPENSFDKKQGMDFNKEIIDPAIAKALAKMLGDIPVVPPSTQTSLLPPPEYPNCVELGDTSVVGGFRTQRYDIAYRPDGIRIVYDSKSLNGDGSISKNWHNMINDIASEATSAHTRSPSSLALFVVTMPKPAMPRNSEELITTLERLNGRDSTLSENHLAEAIAFIVWDPDTGEIDSSIPSCESTLRVEEFTKRIQKIYFARFAGLPPHKS